MIKMLIDCDTGIDDSIAILFALKRPDVRVLGITTGKSPVGVFRALVELHRSEGLSFRNVVVFSLDEFFPITPEELQSRNYSIHESLLDLVDIAPENIHTYGMCVDYIVEGESK